MNFKRIAGATGLSLAIGVAAVWGEEPIRMSDIPDKVALPQKEQDPRRPGGGQFRPGDDGGPSTLPNQRPTLNVNVPKLEKVMEKERNWIFNDPRENDTDSALKELFNVRDYNDYKADELETERTPQSGAQRMYAGEGEKNAARPPPSTQERDEEEDEESLRDGPSRVTRPPTERRMLDSSRNTPEDTTAQRGNLDLTLQSFLNPGRAMENARGNDLGRITFGSRDTSTRDTSSRFDANSRVDTRSKDFQKLIDPTGLYRGTPNLSGLRSDPINSGADATRQQLNPTTASRTDDSQSSAASSRVFETARPLPGIGTAMRPDFLMPGSSRVLGGSSLAPAVSFPEPSAPKAIAQPPTLIIPRRAF